MSAFPILHYNKINSDIDIETENKKIDLKKKIK